LNSKLRKDALRTRMRRRSVIPGNVSGIGLNLGKKIGMLKLQFAGKLVMTGNKASEKSGRRLRETLVPRYKCPSR
jgi:hypothetical protein